MEEGCGIQCGEERQVSCTDLHQPVVDSGSDTIVLPASLAFACEGTLWGWSRPPDCSSRVQTSST